MQSVQVHLDGAAFISARGSVPRTCFSAVESDEAPMPEHSDFFDAAVRLHLFFRFAHAKSVNGVDPVIRQDLVQDDHEEGGSTEHGRIRRRVLCLYQGEDFGSAFDHFLPVGNLVKRQRISDDALVPGIRLNDTGSKLLWRGSMLGEVDYNQGFTS